MKLNPIGRHILDSDMVKLHFITFDMFSVKLNMDLIYTDLHLGNKRFSDKPYYINYGNHYFMIFTLNK